MTLRKTAMEWLKSTAFNYFTLSDKIWQQIQMQIAYYNGPWMIQYPKLEWELFGRILPGSGKAYDSNYFDKLTVQVGRFQCSGEFLGTTSLTSIDEVYIHTNINIKHN